MVQVCGQNSIHLFYIQRYILSIPMVKKVSCKLTGVLFFKLENSELL